MRLIAVIFALLVGVSSAAAQTTVTQSGNVTPTHFACWVTNGVVRDCGTVAFPYATSMGVIAQGPGICQNSAAPNVPYNQICLGNSGNNGVISFFNYGGQAAGVLNFNINGSLYPFPFAGGGNVLGPNSSTVGDLALWNNNAGSLLKDGGGGSVNGNYTFTGTVAFTGPNPFYEPIATAGGAL